MDLKGKGKQIAGNGSSSAGKKRKSNVQFRDDGLKIKRRKNPEVLQFFEESAEVGYYGGSSDEDDDCFGFLNDMEDEPEVEENGKDAQADKGKSSFVFPKEEEMDEEEFDRMMEERYKPGSSFFECADDVKDSIEMDALAPTSKDPPIWKVKCAIGREKHSVFCLMHKFVELKKIGTKLRILSVFYVEHVKGFIFIEADKEVDVLEACNNLTGIYATRMVIVPKSEAPNLLTVQRKTKKFSEETWARVKNGIYKGDLAQVVAVSDTRRRALIKLIPRIDFQALTQKYGGGVTVQKGQIPAPRLINASELEEFRPLIQVRRDRDTGLTFEHLDSMMLKDGYIYKKVSLDALSSGGIIPSKEEILKFTPVERKETADVEWISEIYGEEKKKIPPTYRGGGKGEGSVSGKGEGSGVGKGKGSVSGKEEGSNVGKGKGSVGGKGEGSGGGKGEGSGGGKGEGSSGSKSESSYELYNLVCFSRKDFGLIVGVGEKGDGYKVLKEGLDGPVVVTVGKKEMQNGPFDSKFTALDMNKKQISINDVVKISKGPSEGKQGIVRQVYRGIIFFYDESEAENGGYLCCKSQSCEKVKLFTEEFNADGSAFGDFVSSPKSPLSPEKEWQPRETYKNSNQGDKGSMYSIGQKLRIRVGPLKGYLCRVIALRYSDVTVKLDSQHKVFTVKSENLAEVRDRNTVLSTSGDAGTGSFQPFEMLGTEGSTGDWAIRAGTAGQSGNWNTGGSSTDWNSWGSKPTSDVSAQQPTVPEDNTSTWTTAAAENRPASADDQPGGWSSWNKTPASEAGTVGGWGDAATSKVETSWGKQGASTSDLADLGAWNGGSSDGTKQDEKSVWSKDSDLSQGKTRGSESGSAWGNQGGGFDSGENLAGSSGWNKSAKDPNDTNSKGVPGWGKKNEDNSKKDDGGSSSAWGKKDDGGSSSAWGKKDDGRPSPAWGKKDDGGPLPAWGKKDDGGPSPAWSKKDDGGLSPAWGKKDDGGPASAWGKKDDGGPASAWGKKDDGGPASAWGKKDDGGPASAWGKKDDGEPASAWGKKDDGEPASAWGKKDDGGSVSAWGKKDDGGSSSAWGKKDDGGSSSAWGKKDDGGSSSAWGKKDDGGSSSAWGKKDDGESSSAWGKKDDGGSSSAWGKKDDGGSSSAWGKKDDGGSSSAWGKKDDGGSSSAWGKKDEGGSSSAWGKKDDGGSSSAWGKKKDEGLSGGYLEQTFDRGGRGFGGRRGGGRRGGRDQFGRGSFRNSEDTAPWSKPGGGSDWSKQESDGGGASWRKDNNAGGGSSWGKQDSGSVGSTWGRHDGGGGSGSAWGKQNDGGGGSNWGKQNDASGGTNWGKQDSAGGGSSWGKQDGGCGSGSAWGKQNDDGGGSSWSKMGDSSSKPWNGGGSGSSWGKQDDGGGSGSVWGKQNDGDGGSSWSKPGDGSSKPWNEQGGGGRGFGGRRGGGFRGGFRGGRNQSGRGGRSFGCDQSSTWKPDNQGNTWKSDQSGATDWKKGWGEDSNNRKPSNPSTGGGAANWSSWGTDSKKETNDKPEVESKTAWGTSNDQMNTGNSNDGWSKKPNTDSGAADNAWGSKSDVAAPAPSSLTAWGTNDAPSSSTAWGTNDKKTGW